MVYIDNANIKYGRMIMCHMIADSIDELHAMAVQIGVRKHFQNKPGKPHYDICLSNKKKALSFGAIEITQKQLIRKLHEQVSQRI